MVINAFLDQIFIFSKDFQILSIRSLNLESVIIILLMFWLISLSLQLYLRPRNPLAAAGSCKTWFYLLLGAKRHGHTLGNVGLVVDVKKTFVLIY